MNSGLIDHVVRQVGAKLTYVLNCQTEIINISRKARGRVARSNVPGSITHYYIFIIVILVTSAEATGSICPSFVRCHSVYY